MPTVSESILARRSTRAFLDKPVAKESILDILDVARRSPSGGNVQPWNVHVLAGQELENFRIKIRETLSKNPTGEGFEYDVYPKPLAEPYRSRRYKCGEDLYGTLAIGREDKLSRLLQFARNFELFDAPVGMFFAIDRSMGKPQWAHLGMFIQTIMLLAQERGLASCAQEAWAAVYDTTARYLKLPDSQMLYCGMAMGYADPEAAVNSLVTDRVDIDEFATLRGF